MTLQRCHREAYDIVLSNYPEGHEARARSRTASRAAPRRRARRELFPRRRRARACCPRRRRLAAADAAKIGATPRRPTDTPAAVLPSGARVVLARGDDGGWGLLGHSPKRRAEDLKTARPSTTSTSCAPRRPTTSARPHEPENEPGGRPERRRQGRARRPAVLRIAPHGAGRARRAAHRGDARARARGPAAAPSEDPPDPPTPVKTPRTPRIWVVSELLRAARRARRAASPTCASSGESAGPQALGRRAPLLLPQGRPGASSGCVLYVARRRRSLKLQVDGGTRGRALPAAASRSTRRAAASR